MANQADSCNLLRGLIHQILTWQRKLLKIVRKAMTEQPQLLTNFDRLWDLFERLATHHRVGSLVLIIDAIDECKKDQQERVVKRLARLISSRTQPLIKILITSRPEAAAIAELRANAVSVSRLSLEHRQDLVGEDVNAFIRNRVKKLVDADRCSIPTGLRLKQALRSKAEATFLWVSLALSLLDRRRLLKKSDVGNLIDKIPSDLMRMYESLLEAIPNDDRDYAGKTLRFILAAAGSLTISELNVLISIEKSHQNLADVRTDSWFSTPNSVEILLGGLIKTSDSHVTLIHLTLKEYLSRNRRIEGTVAADLIGASELMDHCSIAESCMRYLLLEDFPYHLFRNKSPITPTFLDEVTGSEPMSDSGSELAALSKEPEEIKKELAVSIASCYELFDYAARFWHSHFAQCAASNNSSELEDLALQLYQMDASRSWFTYLTAVDFSGDEYPVEPDALTLSCFSDTATSRGD